MRKDHKPFQHLGDRLKSMRQKYKESLAEVSGAIEVDVETLEQFEGGDKRPSEELLMLLISHFNVRDEEATQLWELANYSSSLHEAEVRDSTKQNVSYAAVLPMDLRIVYTDMAHVTVNDYGVVMNFMQTSGFGDHPLAVSRVGMSKEHAKKIIEVLNKTLEQSTVSTPPRALPMPKSKNDKIDKKPKN